MKNHTFSHLKPLSTRIPSFGSLLRLSLCAGLFLCGLSLPAIADVSGDRSAKSYGGIIPAPVKYTAGEGICDLGDTVTFYLQTQNGDPAGEESLRAYLSQFRTDPVEPSDATISRSKSQGPLNSLIPVPFNVRIVEKPEEAMVKIMIENGSGIPDEGYVMEVASDGVGIIAPTGTGAFYAVQNILQMTDWGQDMQIPCCKISDRPRFGYRGIHVDVSRHYRTNEFLKKQMDAMALFKLNRMHLHLTDGAGWRLEVEGYPRLTELAMRPQYQGEGEFNPKEWQRTNPGYYTKEDIRELLDYAAQRQIVIIPEIEMPGHSDEVLTAYPELSCGSTDSGPGGSSDGTGERHLSDLCPGKEATYEFLESVLSEVIDLFPSRYIHIGGDEADKSAWKTCPDCQKRMAEEGLRDVDELQSYLIRRIEKFVASKGRRIIGWDEIMQGGLAPGATVMSWTGTTNGIEAARLGNDVIMASVRYCYFDYNQDAPFLSPRPALGYVSLSRTYSFDPAGPDPTEGNIEPSPEMQAHILGLEGCLWAGPDTDDDYAEYMYYPRALALAEVGWTPLERKDYADFRDRALAALETMKFIGFKPFDLANEYGDRTESLSTVEHLARGCKVKYITPCSERYPGRGDGSLTDGQLGGWTHVSDLWQGFNGDMDIIVDLGESREIHSVEATFMNASEAWIHLPKYVDVGISDDGESFETVGRIGSDKDPYAREMYYEPIGLTFGLADGPAAIDKDSSANGDNVAGKGVTTRYIRLSAKVDDRPGAWIFTDEIIVR